MGYPHIIDLNLSLSFNNAKASPLILNPTNPTNLLPFNHGDFGKSTAIREFTLESDAGAVTDARGALSTRHTDAVHRANSTNSGAASEFGKIEGKNVFYWFQNHKARERQRRRRQLNMTPDQQQQYHHPADSVEKKGSSGKPLDTRGITESGGNKWMQIHDKELRLELSCSGTASSSDTGNSCPLKPYQEKNITPEEDNRQDQTLELFPLGAGINISNKDTHQEVPITTTTPRYFEFLPLKN
ncbi:hypothetical protein F3Y22_tig00110893pilonHSYRG00659 [Hibiscus syriacus]|uniref:Uncharacterized protein n=1 Tax=Hibiscus syriacus TaxID=106335 RepID=A0A6A2ZFT1_HIBSY|nr:hypothetical protein F3Y22_tig00110893pilonHSYRG00659 [Hibiscus syriacus]